ncbi:hypothetical protein Q4489_11640 [Thalassotalea sp. 1_MG-2023]|uniref:hypothetical protein n=1 Tax=Thalassotalea sp. 1_MG-2023 TaxID=3062680 RepID=UPI0026E1FF4C|nr:hypothetical protein [Thalassotalea sp. 1_MG-2023]MDO6427674.1 hypothetical protein [Thalassotalea sp. 1_MG-2023]
MKHQKTPSDNSFKTAPLKNAGVELGDKSKRLDLEALVTTSAIIDVQTSRGFVNVPFCQCSSKQRSIAPCTVF